MATRKELREDLSKMKTQSFLNLADVSEMMGFGSANTTKKFVADLPKYIVNNRTRYYVGDIARKLDNSKVG